MRTTHSPNDTDISPKRSVLTHAHSTYTLFKGLYAANDQLQHDADQKYQKPKTKTQKGGRKAPPLLMSFFLRCYAWSLRSSGAICWKSWRETYPRQKQLDWGLTSLYCFLRVMPEDRRQSKTLDPWQRLQPQMLKRDNNGTCCLSTARLMET